MPCVSQMHGGLLCSTAIRKNVSTFLQELAEVGMTLVDCQRGNEFPLRIDSTSWNSFESLILFISFWNSCIRPKSSNKVFWSSTNLRLAIVSNVALWNFLDSSISVRLLWWASRDSKFCCDDCPLDLLLGELWLGQGLCQGLDMSLHEVVVLGLMICGEVGLVSRSLHLFGECAVFLLPSRQVLTTCHNSSLCSHSLGHGRRWLTDRQASSLGVTNVYSVCVMKASPRPRCHRSPHPRGTVAQRTVGVSGTLWRTRQKSPWSCSSWVHDLWGGRIHQ